ncbi:kinase-like domain-containing protein [Pyronema omphalodes]|nr:kinase-like domain-containing protein [Pyronema omphalodes]
MRLRSHTPSQNPSTSPLPLLDEHLQQLDTQPNSTLTSANTSRHTSNTSIYSMSYHHVPTRHSTPPTPISSPGLFRPPSTQPLNSTTPIELVDGQLLHPAQYTDMVRETNQLETDYDPATGRKMINDYTIIDEIGRGTHGKVKLGFDQRTNQMVAIKIVDRTQGRPRLGGKEQREGSETKIRREIAILKKIRHENVVRLIEVIDDDRSKKVYLVLEYVVLGEVVWQKEADKDDGLPAMTIEEARKCFRDTVIGLDHLHWNGIIHRDIKPANLLWTQDKVTKISDFGVSFLGRPSKSDNDDGSGDDEPTGYEQDELELAKTAGTVPFFAPELCSIDSSNKFPITSAIDVWALGVTLFCFIFGRLPFNAETDFAIIRSIAEDELFIPRRRLRTNKPELAPDHQLTPEELEEYETEPVDEELRDLISRLLTKNPTKRILLKDVKRHPWVLRGMEDPVGWVKETDPEHTSHGEKIEVTTEDVETAVSVPSIVSRAKQGLRKLAGAWNRTLRKRGSNATNMGDSKDKTPTSLETPSGRKQGQQKSFFSLFMDDPDKELQWLGKVDEPREDEMLNQLAPSVSASSIGSSETVNGQTQKSEQHEQHDQSWLPGVASGSWAPQPKVRRKQSFLAVGNPLTRRHSTFNQDAVRSTHLAPTEPPPSSPVDEPAHQFKAESTAALVAPSIARHINHSVKADELGRGLNTPRKTSSYEDKSPLKARALLSGALSGKVSPTAVPSVDYDVLPSFNPVSGSHIPLNRYGRTCNSVIHERFERHQKEEHKVAKAVLGKNALENIPINLPGGGAYQENQRFQSEDGSGGPSSESTTSPQTDSTMRSWATAPIAMSPNPRGRLRYCEPPSPRSDGANLVSSSSNERFANTAGSSFTNSTSFPSIATNPSSVSSDFFFSQYSRKGSMVPTEYSQETSYDDEYHQRAIDANLRGRKPSEFLCDAEDEAETDSDESEGGFCMDRRIKRTQSITIGQLARESDEAKDAALRQTSRPPFRTQISSRSSGTVKARKD